MSITFSTSPQSEIVGAEIKCWNFEVGSISTSIENAETVSKSHNENCEDCKAYGGSLIEYDRIVNDINLSNTNAFYVLEKIGLKDQSYGSLNADDFLGRVLLADAIYEPDQGLESRSEGNIHYGGRSPLYLQDKLSKLINLSNWAKENKAEITWG